MSYNFLLECSSSFSELFLLLQLKKACFIYYQCVSGGIWLEGTLRGLEELKKEAWTSVSAPWILGVWPGLSVPLTLNTFFLMALFAIRTRVVQQGRRRVQATAKETL